ncbi:CU044_2847 family protein [Cyanothece sp. BG0011]|uniref:CU044_2847 family protein n=1 Tax=Cyanothece sp. BG0011 TaxID=2082950 RepID=UPI000D1DD5FE|nr:CU044_2847 family protein [Cyanothece sp. BG0011]
MTTKLYFETDQGLDNIDINPNSIIISPEEDDGIDEMGGLPINVSQQLDQAQQMIRECAEYTLNSFKNFAAAEVDEITLKFGIKLAGEAGIPHITKGTAESNIEIQIKCKFPQ